MEPVWKLRRCTIANNSISSYVRTQAILRNLHGVEISQSGINQIMGRAGWRALSDVAPLVEKLRSAAVIYSNEIGSRVDGQNWWQ